jgi:prepilin-type N-terminal cleavage/methylation domain-containing protein
MSRKSQGKYGFTLIELMITIAIVAILVAIAIPSLFHLKDKATWGLAQANLNALRASLQYYNADSEKDIYPAQAVATFDELKAMLPKANLPEEASMVGWDDSFISYTPTPDLQSFSVKVKVKYRYNDFLVASPSGITPIAYPR